MRSPINITMHIGSKQQCTLSPIYALYSAISLQWRHKRRDSVSNHQPHDCLLIRLFRRRWTKTSKLRVTGLCAGNSSGTDEFPRKWPVTRKMFSIWWRHHDETTRNSEILLMKYSTNFLKNSRGYLTWRTLHLMYGISNWCQLSACHCNQIQTYLTPFPLVALTRINYPAYVPKLVDNIVSNWDQRTRVIHHKQNEECAVPVPQI